MIDAKPTPGNGLRQSLLLHSWLSPSLPTGAFSYSHGIESAIEQGYIASAADLSHWLQQLLAVGSLHNECVVFLLAWNAFLRGDSAELQDINALALGLSAGAERYAESVQQAASLQEALKVWPEVADVFTPLNNAGATTPLALPVVAALGLRSAGVAADTALALWSQNVVGNLVWIAVRLVPLGQQDGLSVISERQIAIEKKARALAALDTPALHDRLGSCSLMADIVSLQHEHQGTRLCLS